jgi:hypothetical protein
MIPLAVLEPVIDASGVAPWIEAMLRAGHGRDPAGTMRYAGPALCGGRRRYRTSRWRDLPVTRPGRRAPASSAMPRTGGLRAAHRRAGL